MNTYLTKSKVDLIKEARTDLFDLYGINYTPFTRKIYFYFFVYRNRKYVHKRSLNFVYSNADTYTNIKDPYYCELTKQLTPPNVVDFLSQYKGTLLPELVEENDKFLVYEYVPGEAVESVTEEEFNYIKCEHDSMQLTPFYNSMTYNLARHQRSIKLVDLKHFETKKELPFFIYMYNQQNCVNTLYVKNNTDIERISQHLAADYPVDQCCIIRY
jgi:hypothetical protein